jgi:hypothetical protein
MRFSAASTFSTATSTVSPTFSTSRGCAMRRSDIAEMWINPSTPGLSSTKAPNGWSRTTLPWSRSLSLSPAANAFHGSSWRARIDRVIRSLCFALSGECRFGGSMRSTSTSTVSPTFTTSLG